MNKFSKQTIIFIIAFLFLVQNVFFGCSKLQREFKFSESDIQSKLDPFFPYEAEELIGKIILTNPKVILNNGSDRVNLKIDIAFTASDKVSSLANSVGKFFKKNNIEEYTGTTYKGHVDLFGLIEYRNKTGGFYFKEVEIKKLSIDNVSKNVESQIIKYAPKAANAILKQIPVYTLDAESFAENIAKIFLKSVNVKDEMLVITIGL